jgi:hypothetical protein
MVPRHRSASGTRPRQQALASTTSGAEPECPCTSRLGAAAWTVPAPALAILNRMALIAVRIFFARPS